MISPAGGVRGRSGCNRWRSSAHGTDPRGRNGVYSVRHCLTRYQHEPYLSFVQLRRGSKMVNDKTNASELIDKRIRELGDWRGKTLSKVRGIIKEADPDIVEEWKWVKPTNPETPVWSHNGGICTGATYKNVTKLTFFKTAALN